MTSKQKRTEIKRLLSRLDDNHRNVFISMYSSSNLEKDINVVVDNMSKKHLDWALQQCKNTYYEIFKILAGRA